jgi:hypothetical protein
LCGAHTEIGHLRLETVAFGLSLARMEAENLHVTIAAGLAVLARYLVIIPMRQAQ